MHIYFKEDYRGERSNGQTIKEGEYDLNDSVLCNSGGYFIEYGFAVLLVDEPPANEAFEFKVEPDAEAESVDIETLTNSELRDLLDSKGIDHSAAKNKAALVALFKDGE